MELTQEHFDKSMKALFDYVAKRSDDLEVRLEKVEQTLEVHTKALDRILKDLETRDQERLISIERFERLENCCNRLLKFY